MANKLFVVVDCKVSVAGLPPHEFEDGDEILPGSRYYYPMLWSGLATDSGIPHEPVEPEALPRVALFRNESLDDEDSLFWEPSIGLFVPKALGAAGGLAATIQIDSVTTLAPGVPATVENIGDEREAVLRFGIPRGLQGIQGDQGLQGLKGDKGDQGDPGDDGLDGAPGLQGIQGFTGQTGPPGPIGFSVFGNKTTGETLTMDPAIATDYGIIQEGNITVVHTGVRMGAGMVLELIQDGIGGRTANLSAFEGGTTAAAAMNLGANYLNKFVIDRSRSGVHIRLVESKPAPASMWTPAALDARVAWHAADHVFLEDGEEITTWDNLWAATNLVKSIGTVPLRILNGRKYLSFGGGASMDQIFAPTVAQPFSYGFVARMSGNGPFIGSDLTTGYDIYTTGGKWAVHGGTELQGGNNTTNWQTIVIQVNTSTNDNLRVDGAQVSANTGALKNANQLRLFSEDGDTFGAGGVAEIIMTSDVLTGPEIASMETYLNAIRDDLNGA